MMLNHFKQKTKQNMNIIKYLKKIYLKFKLEKIVIASIVITQLFKRVMQNEFTLLLLELIPGNIIGIIGKVVTLINKASNIAPKVAYTIALSKGLIEDSDNTSNKEAIGLLMKYIDGLPKDNQNIFYSEFSISIAKAIENDGKVSDEEWKELMDEYYEKLFK